MITTNDLKEPAKVEPEKLNVITTAIIPNAEPRPEPKGDGFTKMITTHDEPKKVEEPEPEAEKKQGAKKAK
jgi:hypothetical protein